MKWQIKWHKWRAKSPYSLQLPTSWQQLKQGRRYCQALDAYFAPWFAKVYGQHILKIGGLSAELDWNTPNQHAILLYPDFPLVNLPERTLSCSSPIQASITHLPFYEKAIDACLLANTLNFSQDPHQLLREVTRVLNDDGYLFLSLFNPCSSLLWKRHLQKKSAAKQRWPMRKYLTWRVIDWLELLEFEIIHSADLLKPAALPHFCHFGGQLVVIVARKRTIPLSLNPQKVRFKHPIFSPANALTTPLTNTEAKVRSGD
ncbi:Methylase involved in ubiquinone/menaquinone biosynthesis [Pasteurella testudinis DSM 23072]|uniref:Methylase involved in ubiquinone/menaquinone biosynthesis n=1 Tax=Pasteurella testudinis DSM 23072 TaxID=1122938 RepID=A0A1W1UXG3_9PAST|nr:methyltransferase domain-containing protein [Pasteurella testudinis]SMB85805.1 Methylase involved in ubiquinone/menaquinone biosynthesis [Pasteurella testudinis DSM 23072]SUB51681.1 type 11 methyltransferase [Pasteurella testudinis]